MCLIFFKLSSELTIKDKVLKIFIALFLANVNLTRSQTTKSALQFRKSISLKMKIIFFRGAVHTDVFLVSNFLYLPLLCDIGKYSY